VQCRQTNFTEVISKFTSKAFCFVTSAKLSFTDYKLYLQFTPRLFNGTKKSNWRKTIFFVSIYLINLKIIDYYVIKEQQFNLNFLYTSDIVYCFLNCL